MPFNLQQGAGNTETMSSRFLRALPLLGLFVARIIMMMLASKANTSVDSNEFASAKKGHDFLHSLFQSWSASRIDYAVLYTIFLLEAARPLANSWTPASL